MRDLMSTARAQGWRVEQTRNNHLKFVPPRGRVLFTSSTPSDWRALKNFCRDLRHQGLVLK